ncbi:hypothetical protein BDY19DRAFT_359073 [Irpex rosettiformis]|uniref:Uncharacterized protein n=1 Tax=Irpex rosettiformis TaxID=378272 RepID=A0ACB8TX55_9APHY|nr:hypothetical protein BDY19DRAFT_359073 [Irpex rosettiformis]
MRFSALNTTMSGRPPATSTPRILHHQLSRVLYQRRISDAPSKEWLVIDETQSQGLMEPPNFSPLATSSAKKKPPTVGNLEGYSRRPSMSRSAVDGVPVVTTPEDEETSAEQQVPTAPPSPRGIGSMRTLTSTSSFWYEPAQPREFIPMTSAELEAEGLRFRELVQNHQAHQPSLQRMETPIPTQLIAGDELREQVEFLTRQLRKRDDEITMLKSRVGALEASVENDRQQMKELQECCERADEQFKRILDQEDNGMASKETRQPTMTGRDEVSEEDECNIEPGGNKWPEDMRHRFSMASVISETPLEEAAGRSANPGEVIQTQARIVQSRLSKMERAVWGLNQRVIDMEYERVNGDARAVQERCEVWKRHGALVMTGEVDSEKRAKEVPQQDVQASSDTPSAKDEGERVVGSSS